MSSPLLFVGMFGGMWAYLYDQASELIAQQSDTNAGDIFKSIRLFSF